MLSIFFPNCFSLSIISFMNSLLIFKLINCCEFGLIVTFLLDLISDVFVSEFLLILIFSFLFFSILLIILPNETWQIPSWHDNEKLFLIKQGHPINKFELLLILSTIMKLWLLLFNSNCTLPWLITLAPPKGLIMLWFSLISKLYSLTSDCVIKFISEAVSNIVSISDWLFDWGIELIEWDSVLIDGWLMYRLIKSLRLFDLMFCSILNVSERQQLHPSVEQLERSGGRLRYPWRKLISNRWWNFL